MPTDAQIVAAGTASTPLSYTVPNAQEFILLAVNADVNGSGAASSFVPTVEIVSDAGVVIARAPTTTVVAAAGSAEVSWFPHVGSGGTGTAVPVAAFTSFTFVGGSLTVTATTLGTAQTVVTSNAVTTGSTTVIRVDFGVALLDVGSTAHTGQQSMQLALFRDTTSIGIIADFNPPAGLYGSIPCYTSAFDTPGTGSHTYTVKAFTTTSGGTSGTCKIYANTVGPPNFDQIHPGYIALTTITAP